MSPQQNPVLATGRKIGFKSV